eukprot:Clim_evm3s195 gene=Clim_evmTU3s195
MIVPKLVHLSRGLGVPLVRSFTTATYLRNQSDQWSERVYSAPWPHDVSEIDPHPGVNYGRLSNGFRFAIKANPKDPQTVSLRLLVHAGSLNEDAGELGMAHFVEHLAFCGTENYPGTSVHTTLQNLGLKFGHHSNAQTGFEDTMYFLDLPPSGGPKDVSEGLQILSDFAGRCLFDEDQVKREATVVQSELADTDTGDMAIRKYAYGTLYRGTLIPHRFPDGSALSVGSFTPSALRAFYQQWYRPNNMSLIVVGAVDTVETIKLVESLFGELKNNAPLTDVRPSVDLGLLQPSSLSVESMAHPDVDSTVLELATVSHRPAVPDSIEERRVRLHERIGIQILRKRFQRMFEEPDTIPQLNGFDGRVAVQNIVNISAGLDSSLGFRNGHIHAQLKKGVTAMGATDAFTIMYTGIQNLINYGPTEEELAVELRTIRGYFEQMVQLEPQKSNAEVANELIAHLRQNVVYTTAKSTRELFGEVADYTAPEDIQGAIGDILRSHQKEEAEGTTPRRRVLMLMGKESISQPSASPTTGLVTGLDNDMLLDMMSTARSRHRSHADLVETGDESVENGKVSSSGNSLQWAYGDRPELHYEVASSQSVHVELPKTPEDDSKNLKSVEATEVDTVSESREILQTRYGNNVLVNILRRQEQDNDIKLSVSLDIGPDALPPAGVREMSMMALGSMGLGSHSITSLRDIMAGAKISYEGPVFGERSMMFYGMSLPDSMEKLIQYVRAGFMDPGWRMNLFDRIQQDAVASLEAQESDVASAAYHLFHTLAGHSDEKRRPPTADDVRKVTADQVRDYLEPILATAPMEIGIVGDLDPKQTRKLTSMYFGTMPDRESCTVGNDLGHFMVPSRPMPYGTHTTFVNTQASQACLLIGWRIPDGLTLEEVRSFYLLHSMVNDILQEQVRNKRGDTYSPSADFFMSETFQNFGYLMVHLTCKPQHVGEMREIIHESVKDLSESIDDERVRRTRIPIVKNLATMTHSNSFWLDSVVGTSQTMPFRREWAQSIEVGYRALGTPVLESLATKYLKVPNCLEVIAMPLQYQAKL